MAADAAAFEAGTSASLADSAAAGRLAGVGEAVGLPLVARPGGCGFDMPEADSVPAYLFTDRLKRLPPSGASNE